MIAAALEKLKKRGCKTLIREIFVEGKKKKVVAYWEIAKKNLMNVDLVQNLKNYDVHSVSKNVLEKLEK